jgi:hypothetical protein
MFQFRQQALHAHIRSFFCLAKIQVAIGVADDGGFQSAPSPRSRGHVP